MAILGVSHLVAATEKAESIAAGICGTGMWSPGLTAVGLPIDPGKTGYLAFDHAKHDLRLLRHAAAAPGIEFVRYPSLPPQLAQYRVMFGGGEPAALAAALVEERSATASDVPWVGAIDAPPSHFGLRVGVMERAERFWSDGAGFRAVANLPEGGRLFHFPSFVRGWRSELLLLPGGNEPPRPGMLDDRGWNCASLLVDEPLTAGTRLLEFGGADLTPEIRVSVPGKNGEGRRELRLRFLRGPEGEVVELLAAGSLLEAT